MTDVSPTGDGVTQGGRCTWPWVRARCPRAGSRTGGEQLGEKKVTNTMGFTRARVIFLGEKIHLKTSPRVQDPLQEFFTSARLQGEKRVLVFHFGCKMFSPEGEKCFTLG